MVKEGTKIKILGRNEELEWKQNGGILEIEFPENVEESEAYAFSITPEPYCLIAEKNKPKILTINDLQVMGLDKHW